MYRQGSIPNKTLRQSGVADRDISVFLCPSDRPLGAGQRQYSSDVSGFPVGNTNYKGVSGANWGDDTYGIGPNIDTDWRNAGTNGSFNGLDLGDGMMYRTDSARGLRLTSVTDGTSNTFMIGEDVPANNVWCSWPYANNAYGTCAIPPNVELRYQGPQYKPGDWQNLWSFRSRHAGGLHFATADGAVRFIADTIDLPTYRALATIQGGGGRGRALMPARSVRPPRLDQDPARPPGPAIHADRRPVTRDGLARLLGQEVLVEPGARAQAASKDVRRRFVTNTSAPRARMYSASSWARPFGPAGRHGYSPASRRTDRPRSGLRRTRTGSAGRLRPGG